MKRLLLVIFVLLLCNSSVLAQSLTPTGTMQSPRAEHTATLLSGGTSVLVTGGWDRSGSLATADIYDSTSGSFSRLANPMHSPRLDHTATLLNSGQVLIAGGYDGGYLSSAELFNPGQGTFIQTGSMSDARILATATLLNNGQVLITGGLNQTGYPPTLHFLSSAELYVSGENFRPAAPMNSPRYGHAATLLNDGKVLITGGCTGRISTDCVNTAEIYDPEYETFTPTNGTMNYVHAWHTSTLLSDGTVLIAGGVEGALPANCAEIYDPVSGTFTPTAGAMVGLNSFFQAATILFDGSVLIAGGDSFYGISKEAQLYLPASGNFSLVLGTMSTPRRYHTATLLGNGQALIVGGADGSNVPQASADLYTASGSITQTLSSSGGTASFIFENNLYNIVFNYPPGFVGDGSTLTATPIQTSQTAWGSRTSGTPYAGTKLAPVFGLGGDGIIYQAACRAPGGGACQYSPSDLTFTVKTSWDGSAFSNPGFLKADIGGTNWQNVFFSSSATRTRSTIVGKSKEGFSDWAAVYNVTASKATTSTSLGSSLNPVATNQPLTLTATVTSQYGGAVTGTVTFTVGSLTLGSASLSGNAASLTTYFAKAGTYSISAHYNGDANNIASTSAPLSEKVIAATSVTLTSSLNPSVIGQAVTFTATVASSAGIPPNGETITFYNGTSVLGTGPLSGGIATIATSSLPAGVFTVKASYPGDLNFAPSTSAGLRQVVNSTTKYATTTALATSLNPSRYGQAVTFTAKVTTSGPLPPTGTIAFTWKYFTTSYTLGTATVNSSGIATLTRSNLNADSYPLTAVYMGDANNLPSTSAVVNQTVMQTTTSATITSSLNPSKQGQAVTFTAKISSPTVMPEGPVTFSAGTTVLGSVQLSSGKATFTTSALPAGSTLVKATYNGNSNIKGSSASLTHTVQP